MNDGVNAVRCRPHGLAVGRDGKCVICRREAAAAVPGSTGGSRVFVLLGVGLVLVALAGGALTLVEARRETPPAPVAVTPPPVITALPAPSEPTAHASAGDMWSARRSVPITMYTTTWCPACKKARAWMNREGISYRERDVEASPEAHAEMRRLNPGGGVPTLDIDGEVLVGFDSHGIDQAIQSAADRRLRRR